MLTFYKEYQSLTIGQPPVAKLEKEDNLISPLSVSELERNETSISPILLAKLQVIDSKVFTKVSWSNHTLLIEKIKDLSIRFWYMKQIVQNGWSYDTLVVQIKSKVHERQGTLINNFDKTLAQTDSNWAKHLFKDPYIFDFTTLTTEFTERELELNLVKHVEKFLVELGAGFAFVGRQYKLEVSDRDFYVDLLFYHLKMRCFIVIELKKGDFLPEYAGKMNFYCSAVDEQLKHETDSPTYPPEQLQL
jgi:predicted nuclease of restriction endonuclease-like (RecB) superfamily